MVRCNPSRVFPIICAAAMEQVTTNNHEPPTHLGFCLLHYCATKATSAHSPTCIYDRESRSLEPSSSAIQHQGRVNKVFGNRSSQLLTRFFKFFIMTHLTLRRRLQRELCRVNCHLHPIIVIKELQVTYDFSSQIMSYILSMLNCVGMILLDNLLQCLPFISIIDLSRTCGSTASLICNALVMLIIYPWTKIKQKVLIFPTPERPQVRCVGQVLPL
jgi:hypothetical protein